MKKVLGLVKDLGMPTERIEYGEKTVLTFEMTNQELFTTLKRRKVTHLTMPNEADAKISNKAVGKEYTVEDMKKEWS